MKKLLFKIAALVSMLLIGPQVMAGANCEYQPQKVTAIKKQIHHAAKLYQLLSDTGAQVLFLARTGQDLSDYHLTYSHMAFAYQKSPGRWEVVHKLNHCDSTDSKVFRQGLLEFLTDDLWNQQFAWMEPSPAVQTRLIALLQDEFKIQQMDEKHYSMLAYAWGTRYQQSNQWLLETYALAAAPEKVFNRQQAQQWLRESGYQPDAITINPLKRNLADWTRASIALDDHPAEDLKENVLWTVTADSIFAYIQNQQAGGELQFTHFTE